MHLWLCWCEILRGCLVTRRLVILVLVCDAIWEATFLLFVIYFMDVVDIGHKDHALCRIQSGMSMGLKAIVTLTLIFWDFKSYYEPMPNSLLWCKSSEYWQNSRRHMQWLWKWDFFHYYIDCVLSKFPWNLTDGLQSEVQLTRSVWMFYKGS